MANYYSRSGKTYCGRCDSALIGNGLYMQVSRGESLLEAYRRIQQTCNHEKRDPRGTCYQCGQKEDC